MTVEEQRTAISKVYPTEKWKNKVENMPEDQVIAIYLAFEKRGLLGKVITKPYQRKMESAEKAKSATPFSKPYQLTIDDILSGKKEEWLKYLNRQYQLRLDSIYGWGINMSLDKAITSGKEKRKPFYGCKAFDPACRNHGSDIYMTKNRLHNREKREQMAKANLKDYQNNNWRWKYMYLSKSERVYKKKSFRYLKVKKKSKQKELTKIIAKTELYKRGGFKKVCFSIKNSHALICNIDIAQKPL